MGWILHGNDILFVLFEVTRLSQQKFSFADEKGKAENSCVIYSAFFKDELIYKIKMEGQLQMYSD